jgi:branched-chain amino acid transport system substrate-binding protein
MRLSNRSATAVLALLMLVPAGAAARPERPSALEDPIVIGLHIPVTGAVPLPSPSHQTAAEIYWKWRRHLGLTIFGRDVEVVVKNDNTNPSQARQVCREMVDEGVTMLAGVLQGAFGAPQIQECARVAKRAGIPYVSLGTVTQGVADNPNYFATSMSLRAQGRLLADYFVEKLDARDVKNAIVASNIPSVLEGVRAFRNRLGDRKAEIEVERLISHNAGATEAQAVATELSLNGIENVFVLHTPTFFIQLGQATDNQQYFPMWSGVGITMTSSDAVAMQGCNGSGPFRARFFSPLPAFRDRGDYDPDFDRAMTLLYPTQDADEVVWQGWSTAKQLAEILIVAGPKWSTKQFISRVESARTMRTGIMPELNFAKGDHFGAWKTHVLKEDCSARTWSTIPKKYY